MLGSGMHIFSKSAWEAFRLTVTDKRQNKELKAIIQKLGASP